MTYYKQMPMRQDVAERLQALRKAWSQVLYLCDEGMTYSAVIGVLMDMVAVDADQDPERVRRRLEHHAKDYPRRGRRPKAERAPPPSALPSGFTPDADIPQGMGQTHPRAKLKPIEEMTDWELHLNICRVMFETDPKTVAIKNPDVMEEWKL